jgi:NAD(P)-dependent dehydrogenase (short-subunit alcohol dehydrogenase family)
MSTVLITGANRGIGLELTRRYAARGDRVHACCRNPAAAEALEGLAESFPGLAVQTLDPADGASVAALAQALGGEVVDVLINNAGAAGPAPERQSLAAMDYDGWLATFAVNTLAPVRVLQALRPNLARSGQARAVTVTSQMGAIAWPHPVMYAYCASKAAVNKVMKMASVELGKEGITVALVHPGWVRTDMGGPGAEISVEESAAGIIAVIDALTPDRNGNFYKWNGEIHPW